METRRPRFWAKTNRGEKSMYGKKTMGTIRTTFVINEEGIIEQIFAGKQVKTKEHAEQILTL